MSSRIKLKGATAKAEAPRFAHLTFAAVVLASSLLLSACNTAEGVGEDVSEAGEEVEDAID